MLCDHNTDDPAAGILAVGSPYLPGRDQLPPGFEYTFRGGAHQLLLVVDNLRRSETEDIAHGSCEFAVAVHQPVTFFLWRFGTSFPWSDSPYSYWMLPDNERQPPRAWNHGEPHAVLTVVLVEAETGLVRALRAVSLSPALTTALHLAIHQQVTDGWSGAHEYDQALMATYSRYPTTEALLQTAQVRAPGGS